MRLFRLVQPRCSPGHPRAVTTTLHERRITHKRMANCTENTTNNPGSVRFHNRPSFDPPGLINITSSRRVKQMHYPVGVSWATVSSSKRIIVFSTTMNERQSMKTLFNVENVEEEGSGRWKWERCQKTSLILMFSWRSFMSCVEYI